MDIPTKKNTVHVPVLQQEMLYFLSPSAGGLYMDGTVGSGGHSRLLLESSSPDGKVIAFDRDHRALEVAGRQLKTFGDRISFVHDDFRNFGSYTEGLVFDGILLDLGVSSMQLNDPKAGFSFQHPGPLDMRMDVRQKTTAADIVNEMSPEELKRIIWKYGEEKRARRIAEAITAARSEQPVLTTDRLVQIVLSVITQRPGKRIHPATKTFQALRIAVNNELEGLDQFIKAIIEFLKPGGRLAIISFHSLEDRVVKWTFRELAGTLPRSRYAPQVEDVQPKAEILTRKPIRPGEDEIETNPRSRSARMRVVQRLAEAV